MATWTCGNCTAETYVGAPRCPQCGSEDVKEITEMAKTSKTDGPTDATIDGYFEEGAVVGASSASDVDAEGRIVHSPEVVETDYVAPEEDPDAEGDETEGPVDPGVVTEPVTPLDESRETEVETYVGDEWNGDALRAELSKRQLPTAGAKADLSKRLVEDDAAKLKAEGAAVQ